MQSQAKQMEQVQAQVADQIERALAAAQTKKVDDKDKASPRTPTIPAPKTMEADFTLSQFETWVNVWRDYITVTEISKFTEERKLSIFRGLLSLEMRSALTHALDVKENTKDTVDEVLDKIRKYIRGKRNGALDCVAFDERKQHADETFDAYLVAVKELATNANLCQTCWDERLATRIMSGVRDSQVKKKLLALTPFPKLKAVVDLCRSEECASNNEAALSSARNVNNAFKYPKHRSKSRARSQDRDPKGKHLQCGNCGWEHEGQMSSKGQDLPELSEAGTLCQGLQGAEEGAQGEACRSRHSGQ